MPLAILYPTRMVQTLKISFAEGMNFTSDQVKIDDPAFKFSYRGSFEKNEVTLRYSYETLADHVEAARVPDYLKNLDYEVWCSKDLAQPSAFIPVTANSP